MRLREGVLRDMTHTRVILWVRHLPASDAHANPHFYECDIHTDTHHRPTPHTVYVSTTSWYTVDYRQQSLPQSNQ